MWAPKAVFKERISCTNDHPGMRQKHLFEVPSSSLAFLISTEFTILCPSQVLTLSGQTASRRA
jgi:hypothetical protein